MNPAVDRGRVVTAESSIGDPDQAAWHVVK